MNDDRFATYLRSRAATVDVPLTEVAVIAERAQDRRHRRHVRAARAAGLVVVLAATATAVAISSDGRTPVASTPFDAEPSALEWQVVQPQVGLGFARSTVGADTLYSLSTAPGPMDLGADPIRSNTLYRSADGVDWEALAMPEDLYASALGLDGGRLYAVGTGPVGDDERIPLRLGWSDDGGGSWATEAIDLGIADLQARYPDELTIGPPAIATRGGTTVIATAISATIDLEARAPDLDLDGGFATTPEGIDVYEPGPLDCDRGDPCTGPEVVAHHTWEELGVPAELVALQRPDLVLLARTGDGPFERIEPPTVDAYGSELVVTDAGFTLLVQDLGPAPQQPQVADSVLVFTSPDGRSWEARPAIPGYLESAGRMPGGVGISTRDDRGAALVTILGDAGGRRSLSPLEGLPPEILDEQPFTGAVAFGPLGWATVATASESGGRVLLHSDPTGTAISTVAFPPELRRGMESGVVVSADAIAVRFTEGSDGDPATVPVQRLYVGTPTGP